MNKPFKTMLCLLISLIMLFSLSACEDKKETSSENTSEATKSTESPEATEELPPIGYSQSVCSIHSPEYHTFDDLLDLDFRKEYTGLITEEEFSKWRESLGWTYEKSMSNQFDYCLLNLHSMIEYFKIPREKFQKLLDENPNLTFHGEYNLDVLYSGDIKAIEEYYSIENQELHLSLKEERERKYYTEKIAELQKIVNDNTKESKYSKYYHDIVTYSSSYQRIHMLLHQWMEPLVESGEYEKVNMFELINYLKGHSLTKDAFEERVKDFNLQIYADYNVDLLFADDREAVEKYYSKDNEAAQMAKVRTAYEEFVSKNEKPDISWMIDPPEWVKSEAK